MKKLAYLISLLLLVLIPFKVGAMQDISYYTTRNLEETLDADDIDITFKNYSESQNQVTIYLFWRYGCPYCGKFLTYLDNIADEYDKDEKYDVLSEMKKAQDEELRKNKISNLKPVIYNLIINVGAVIILCFFIKKQNNKIQDRLDVIYEKLNITIDDEEKEAKSRIGIDDESKEIAPQKKIKTNKQVKKGNNKKTNN